MAGDPRPELAGLEIADPPERWRALGFAVEQGRLELGGVEVELGAAGTDRAHAPPAGDGIVGWTLRHVEAPTAIDGLATRATAAPPPPTVTHPNQAVAIDHVVVTTPDFDRTAQALESAGMSLRRIREAGSFRQGFRRLGPAILELVEARDAPPGPAAFWGLVVVAEDLEALSARISPHLGQIRPAVQPGRLIATLADSAGLSPRIAFMDPGPER
jgi:hypothetical protein